MGVEVRKVDEPVYDGTTGTEVDTVTRYELGAEIDGAWVSFASKGGDKVDQLIERAKEEKSSKGSKSKSAPGDKGAPSMAPNAAAHE